MKYKIIVDKQSRTNPSADKKTYEVDIEELRCKGNIYDSLTIEKDRTYVTRRLSLSDLHVLSVLEEPKIEELQDLNIELFEGDNYIYLQDMIGNKFYTEYLIKNDFNDIYITKNEMNTAINQTAQSIDLAVNQKLTGYSTTEEMNSAINLKADSITESVSKSYATKDELATEKSERIQTATEINQIVSKKVGNDEVISKINQTLETITIDANKININGTVSANGNFKIDTEGNMECNNADISGKVTSSDGMIGGWTINGQGLSNGTVVIKNDGASTIYTVADLIIIRNYIMGIAGFELSQAMIKHYDFNGDGQVTSADYVELQNLIGISMD